MRCRMKTSRPSVLAVILLFASAIPGIMAQIATPGDIQNANSPGTSTSECLVSDYELPTELGGATPPGFQSTTFGLVAAITAGWVPALSLSETPIAVRFTRLIDALDWNCAAVYSDIWNDALTETDPIVRTPKTTKAKENSLFVQEVDVSLHTSSTRFLCAVHGWHAIIEDWIPDATKTLLPVLESLGLKFTDSLGYSSEVGNCFGINSGTGESVAEQNCLEDLAKDHCYTPAIMGQIVGRQVAEYARTDGWNQDGTLSKDGSPCTANCRRFSDYASGSYTGYEPVHHPGSTDPNVKTRWMPLLEDDIRGYETRQAHVTPHIGALAKPAAVSREEIDTRIATQPSYFVATEGNSDDSGDSDDSNENNDSASVYNEEAMKVIERLRVTAGSDETKMKIEWFDNKLNVAVAVIGTVANTLKLQYEEVLNFALALTAGDYDAVILAWKEKVHYDLVRPTTWIQEMMGDKDIETYAGPGQGVQTIKGRNFESYVRVMPHSEYVSGSACLCQALMELTDHWVFLKTAGVVSTVNVTIPGPAGFPAGSSKTEPGVTPEFDIPPIVLNGMNELRNQCGQSRLDGGMHFSESVDNSYTLCSGVGIAAADYAFGLAANGNFAAEM